MRIAIGIACVAIVAGCGSGSGGTPSMPDSGGTAGHTPAMASGGATRSGGATGNGGASRSGGATGSGGAGGQVPLGRCFVGNPALAPELSLVYRTTTVSSLSPIADLTMVPLSQPPQGGEALFIGVRARNIDGCPLMMSAALLAPDSDVVVAFERRPVNLEAAGDGWLQPSQPTAFSNFSNLPSCPKAGLARPVDGEQYRLQVLVDDPEGRHGEITVLVVPSCGTPTPSATCHCLCAANYVLGSTCP